MKDNHNSPIELPSRKQSFKGDWEPTPPTQEVLMKPGDFMYIPRGIVHEAITTDDYSLHITLAVLPYTYAEFVRIIFENLENDLFFRNTLPIKFDLQEIIASNFIEKTFEHLKNSDLRSVLNEMKDKFISQRSVDASNRLVDYIKVDNITLDTKISKRDTIIFDVIESHEIIHIRFYNKQISLPIYTKPALNYILNNKFFTPATIESHLDIDSNLLLCKKLIQEGFLTIID